MMTNAQLATASLDDIVFDGRNRGYGAYELRALYQRHMTRALVIATAVCALLLVFPLLAQLLKDKTPPAKPKVFVTATIIAPPLDKTVVTPPAIQVVRPPATPPQQPTIKDVVPVVVDDKKAPEENEVPNRNELIDKPTGTKNIVGDPNAPEMPLDELLPEKGPSELSDVVDTKTYVSVEQMPELSGGGGQAAIVAAIQRAVRYPSLALRNGVEGRVFVSFTVNAKGQVIDAKILKGLGSGLDEETLRAIGTLPKFIPGKQNGREVSVSFSVPVTYRIQ